MTFSRWTDLVKFREIAPGLHKASRKMTNVYAYVSDGQTVLIDTGEPSFGPAILRALTGFPPVSDILLTHIHYDHVGSAAQIAKATGARVHAHPVEAALLANGKWRRPCTPSPSILGHLLTRLVADRFPNGIDPVEAHAIEGNVLDVVGGIRVLSLPGHSSGQVGFGVRTKGTTAWIVGDAAMNVLGLREPILYEDRATGLGSIATLAQTAADSDLLCFGHGRPMLVTSSVKRQLESLTASNDTRASSHSRRV